MMNGHLSSLAASCGLVLLLAACASPRLRAPAAVDLPEVWRAPLPHGGSTAALADWWQAFPDPMLVTLIERAQAANPNLQAAAARHRQARALVTQVRASLLPQLGASATSSRGKNLNNTPGVSTQSDSQFNASWEIDLFGGKRAEAEEQAAQADAAQHDWHAARVTLAADVAAAYVNLRLAQAREEVAELDGLLAAQLAAWGRQQQAVGLMNASDAALLRTDASLATARRSAERAEAQVALQELAVLLGVPAAPLAAELQAPALPAAWMSPRRLLPSVPGFAVRTMPAQLLAQRPDVAAAHQRWWAAQAHQRSVDAQRYPQLSLGALIGDARLSVGGQSSVSSLWSIGPSLTLPLFDGGARRAQGQAALAAADEAAAALQAKWQTAVAEVEESLERMAATRDRLREAESVAREWQGIAQRAVLQARAGLHSGPQRAISQRNALTAHDDLLAAQADQAQAWFRLYRSLGGGWNADPGPTDQVAAQP
ncbi:efflux transporter outer membrane subunit [Pollutimonas bauzanensis]|uniref:Efflux transporter, outer membrane factor (OMF) lipoprotein, NodT family n=1 Tax=Pollutimonas bauzanensis TaxID=658167 RepID=A0A1M5X8D3_9BURK|nr:efflux transporter outer membrane subunit [Pollutimonas bauzanensis]SHH96041.1 efflux transporter, outer membrane factor (OMF) lipoprotein, NodT family [Pollutimonas bauzanensis]